MKSARPRLIVRAILCGAVLVMPMLSAPKAARPTTQLPKLTADPRVPLTRSWLGSNCKGCTNNAATEAARGSQAGDWPLAEIVRRGYALAAFYSGDVDPDRK